MEEKHSEAPKEEFQCMIDGCKQSFSTEVHRNVHSKKHDLNLALEMPLKGQGGIFADQTPTPTRLIGKCEEVGLFEDLQKVNPFDETFRRAVESGASSSSSLTGDQTPSAAIQTIPLVAEGETLHTPHIFPSTVDRSTQDAAHASNEAVAKQRTKIKGGGSSGPTNEPRSSRRLTSMKRKIPTVVDILPKPPSAAQPTSVTEPIPVIIIPSSSSEKKLPTPGAEQGVKEKLKEHLAKVRESSVEARELPVAKKRSKKSTESADNAGKPSKPIDLTKMGEDQADLKHERWKAAAKRYRMRVKKSQDQQHKRNIELEEENLRLRTELAEMKHRHRNCSLMREQRISAVLAQGITQATTVPVVGTLEASIGMQQEGGAIMLGSLEQQQAPLPLTGPQQRLITSHIIDSHTFNRMPIFIVMAPPAETVPHPAPDPAAGSAFEGGNVQNA